MIKINDIFKIEKETITGVNPITKETVEFERYIFTANEIKFTRHEKSYIEDILNMDFSYNEYNYIRRYLADYVNYSKEIGTTDEDELMIEKVLVMKDSKAVRTYLIYAFSDILFTYLSSDMEEDEIRMFINNEIEYRIFKKLCELVD
ncbi:hypothetical protein [Clostridium nigeriense]|uniref:hypothetical protein n=1 Tax=Clostridium nigeriense TaxID=1805470 RepID=UPI0008349517|nr:hypothetical protein [Clostridium nigeriense]